MSFFRIFMLWLLALPVQFYGLLKKDYLLLLRRRKYLYLALALPLVISLIYIFTINPKPPILEIGACDHENSAASSEVLRSIDGFKTMILKDADCESALKEQIRSGRIMFGIVIPKTFSQDLKSYKTAHLTAYFDNSDIALANYLDWKINVAINEYKASLITKTSSELKQKANALDRSIEVSVRLADELNVPKTVSSELNTVRKEIKDIKDLDTGFIVNPLWIDSIGIYDLKNNVSIGITFIFPIIVMFILFLLISTNVIFEKKINFFKRLKASPTSNFLYLAAKLVFFFLITVIQFLVVLIIFLIAGASLSIDYPSLLLALIFIAAIDTLIGILIGLVSDSEGVAVLISLILTLPLMFLSGIFFPIKLLPTLMQSISALFPLSTQITLMKKVILFDQAVSAEIFYPVMILFIATLIYLRKR